jgi:hypothetical protein
VYPELVSAVALAGAVYLERLQDLTPHLEQVAGRR